VKWSLIYKINCNFLYLLLDKFGVVFLQTGQGSAEPAVPTHLRQVYILAEHPLSSPSVHPPTPFTNGKEIHYS